MPKYTNSTTADIVVGSYRIPAGESITIQEYFQTLPTGLAEDTSVGFYNPCLQSALITGTTTSTIVATTTSYVVKLFCSTGAATIKFNDASATAFQLVAGQSIEVKCFNRIIDSVITTIASSGTVSLNVEKI